MTKKKRLRKEQRQRRGNPPPPQVTPVLDSYDRLASPPPDNLLIVDERADPDDLDDPLTLEGLSSLGDSLGKIGPDYLMRPMERQLMRIQRYLERHGITITPENEHDVEELLAREEWRSEAEHRPSTSLERAQVLVYDAFELPETRWQERIPLAKQALTISHNCADAHVLLAELDSPTDEVARRHYTDAVKAAERALKDVDVGSRPRDFWHLMKVRPLLRALSGAAYINHEPGGYEQALDVYRRLYAIDQLDVMEVRDAYIGLLMEHGLDEELIRFLEQQGRLDRLEKDTAHVQYSYALSCFRLEGDTETARSALHTAGTSYPLILRYLLGVERATLDPLILPGSDEDHVKAVEYFMYDCRLWLRTPNAVEWLRANTPGEVLETTSQRKR